MTARFGETFAVTVDNMESSIMHRIVACRQAIKNKRVAQCAMHALARNICAYILYLPRVIYQNNLLRRWIEYAVIIGGACAWRRCSDPVKNRVVTALSGDGASCLTLCITSCESSSIGLYTPIAFIEYSLPSVIIRTDWQQLWSPALDMTEPDR